MYVCMCALFFAYVFAVYGTLYGVWFFFLFKLRLEG